MTAASRVARKPVTIPSGVDVKVQGQEISIKGPKGNFIVPIHPFVEIVIEDKAVIIKTNEKSGYR